MSILNNDSIGMLCISVDCIDYIIKFLSNKHKRGLCKNITKFWRNISKNWDLRWCEQVCFKKDGLSIIRTMGFYESCKDCITHKRKVIVVTVSKDDNWIVHSKFYSIDTSIEHMLLIIDYMIKNRVFDSPIQYLSTSI